MAALERLNASLPRGFTARDLADADVEALVALLNEDAPEQEAQSAIGFRRWRELNPQPDGLDLVVAAPGGALVAGGQIGDGGIFATPDRAQRAGLNVAAAHRRKGIGRAVLAALEAHARGQGAPKVTARVREDDPGSLAFARARGYEEYHRRYNASLDLTSFDAARFEDPAGIAARAGACLESLGDLWSAARAAGNEDSFLRHFHEVNTELLHDVPRPDPFVAPPFEATRKLLGSPTLDRRATIVALDGDRVIGLTITDVSEMNIAYTFMTGVARSARGKGLALALKLRAIEALRRRDGVRWFGTTNDEANAPMRAVNRKLGYVTKPASIQVRRSL